MCVTRGEWLAVHKSMTRARVHSIFNSAGKQIPINYLGDGYVCEFQGYRTCVGTSDSYVRVSFQNQLRPARHAPGCQVHAHLQLSGRRTTHVGLGSATRKQQGPVRRGPAQPFSGCGGKIPDTYATPVVAHQSL
jgi:hypothetical protein